MNTEFPEKKNTGTAAVVGAGLIALGAVALLAADPFIWARGTGGPYWTKPGIGPVLAVGCYRDGDCILHLRGARAAVLLSVPHREVPRCAGVDARWAFRAAVDGLSAGRD